MLDSLLRVSAKGEAQRGHPAEWGTSSSSHSPRVASVPNLWPRYGAVSLKVRARGSKSRGWRWGRPASLPRPPVHLAGRTCASGILPLGSSEDHRGHVLGACAPGSGSAGKPASCGLTLSGGGRRLTAEVGLMLPLLQNRVLGCFSQGSPGNASGGASSGHSNGRGNAPSSWAPSPSWPCSAAP